MLWAFLRRWLHLRRVDEDLDAEIQTHFETLIQRQVAKGLSYQEARRAVRLEFGGPEQVKQTVREERAGAAIEAGLEDVRFAWRILRKSPGFTAVAIVTLALGIGANTAVFSIVNAVLLQPLPYAEPDRIVQLESPGDDPDLLIRYISIPKVTAFREQAQIFEHVALYYPGGGRMNLTGGDRPEQVAGMRVSSEFLPLFGAPMALGRTFTADEDRAGGPEVAVISNGLWHRRYGGDPGLIGRKIDIGTASYEVIGVLGPGFHWDSPVDIWVPLRADPNSLSHSHDYYAAARLRPGVSLEQASAAMKVVSEEFRRKFPPEASFFGHGFLTPERMQDVLVKDVRPALRLLLGAVGLVLLIACANVANLLLARASVRRREIAIRSAVGAGRRQIIRQLLTESTLLSLAGGVVGLFLGYFGLRELLLINPGNIPLIGEHGAGVTMDGRVLVFTLLVSALTGIFFGLIPAIQSSRTDLSITLKESDTRFGAGVRQNRARWILVVAEIALAVVLLVGSSLLLRTYMALRAVQPGFDANNILTMGMSTDEPRFYKTAAVAQLVRAGTESIERLPGVEAAATTSSLPLEPIYEMFFTIEGRPLADKPYHGMGAWRSVSTNYFDVFRIPLASGRRFTEHDDGAGAPVVVINETMARRFWPDSNPVGQRITLGKGLGAPYEESAPRMIIGVVGDVRDDGLKSMPDSIMYMPVEQLNDGTTAVDSKYLPLMWAIRTKATPYSLSPKIISEDIQRELRKASGGLPVGQIRSMDQVMVESIARNDFNATLFAIFAGVAVMLAAIGIYGLVAYSVQQRTHEIGVRMALGAQKGDVLRMVAGSGMKLVLIGLCAGIASSLALTRLLSSLLFGVRPTDPGTLTAVAFGLLGVGGLACLIPARRATKVGPMVALRHE
jgi:putative ABC transport system permease protein